MSLVGAVWLGNMTIAGSCKLLLLVRTVFIVVVVCFLLGIPLRGLRFVSPWDGRE